MQSANKMCVALLFGGMSSEHEVSCVSVGNFVRNIDRSKYVLFGGAGCLDKEIARGKVMVPTAAYRYGDTQ